MSQISMEWRSVLACKAINVRLKFKSQKDVVGTAAAMHAFGGLYISCM